MSDRFQAEDKAPGGARINDTLEGRTVAIFLPRPGYPKAAKLLADRAARAFNEWWQRVEADRVKKS